MKARMKVNGSIPNTPKARVADPIIYSSMCPASILANSRILRLRGRMRKDNISIITSSGVNHSGIPLGRKIRRNWILSVITPTMIQVIKKLRESSKVKIICAVIV